MKSAVTPSAFVAEALRGHWLYIVGDSSARMLFGALVELINGSLLDPRFGAYRWHDKGGCSHEGGDTAQCLREYVNLSTGTRVTFSFKTVATERTHALDLLASPSQAPDYFLLAVGAWTSGTTSARTAARIVAASAHGVR